MASRYHNTTGIIYRMLAAKEADAVLYLLDQTGSQHTIVAKGIKKPKSRKAHAIDLLNQVEVKLTDSGGLPMITEIKLVNNPKQFKQDYAGLMFVQLICEIVQEFAQAEQNESGLYNNLENLLSVNSPSKYALLAAALILRYLATTGNLPKLDQDIYLGSGMIEGADRYPALEIGYTANQQSQIMEAVPDRLYKVQKFVLRSDFNQIHQLSLTPEEQLQLFRLHSYWLELLTGKQLKVQEMFLQAIKDQV